MPKFGDYVCLCSDGPGNVWVESWRTTTKEYMESTVKLWQDYHKTEFKFNIVQWTPEILQFVNEINKALTQLQLQLH